MKTDQIIITLRVLGRFKQYKEACEEAICILGRQLVEEGNADSEENELSMQLNVGESKKGVENGNDKRGGKAVYPR